MASVILAVGAIVYFSAEGIQKHRKEKKALKVKDVLVSPESNRFRDWLRPNHQHNDSLPAYSKKEEKLPAYDPADLHPALRGRSESPGPSLYVQ
jgi:hypothetical protein